MNGPTLSPQLQPWKKLKDRAVVLTVSAHAAMPNYTRIDVHVTVDPGVSSCPKGAKRLPSSKADGRRCLRFCSYDDKPSALRLRLVLTASRYPSPQFGCHCRSYFKILGHIAAMDAEKCAEVFRPMHLHEIIERCW